MANNVKILAIHGMWGDESLFDEFRQYFDPACFDFRAITLNWDDDWFSSKIAMYCKVKKPDCIIAYSFGAYAVQKAFCEAGHFMESVKTVFLVGPIGPRGMGAKTFLRLCANNIVMVAKGMLSGVFKIEDDEADRLGINFKRRPEKTRAILKAWPYFSKVKTPINSGAKVVVVSGGNDKFVSKEDARRICSFHKATLWRHLQDHDHYLLTGEVAKTIIRDMAVA